MYMKTPLFTAILLCILSGIGSAQVFEYETVTDDLLQNPPAHEWLSWRGTPRSWGYSPLNQINAENVKSVVDSGADSVCVVSAITMATDPELETQKIIKNMVI